MMDRFVTRTIIKHKNNEVDYADHNFNESTSQTSTLGINLNVIPVHELPESPRRIPQLGPASVSKGEASRSSGSASQIQMVVDEEEDLKHKNQTKKKKYKQQFKDKWLEKFKWLKRKDSLDRNSKPTCTVCNIKIHCNTYNIKRHEGSESHRTNMKKILNTPKLSEVIPVVTEARQKHDTLVKKGELGLCVFLQEHNLPFLLADHLCKFISHVCPDSDIAKSLACSRTKATYITKECLAREQIENMATTLQSTVFSIIIDETTDISTEKSLALVVRYYDDKTMSVRDRFFGLLKLESCTAEAIFNTVMNHITSLNIPITNLIGLAADNASVMMGKHTGVQARFKELLPNLFVLGCICHSFHLCASAAANKLPRSLEEFIREIYNYFSNSSKRLEKLKECQLFVNLKPHKMLHPAQTRWLSLQAAVDRVLENWEALILCFTNESFQENLHSCNKILDNLKKPIYKIYFTFLSYVLDIVNKLNLEFQSEKTKIHLVQKRVSELYKTLLRNFIKKEHLDNIETLKHVDPKNPRLFVSIHEIYCGARVELLLSNDVDPVEVHNFKIRSLEFYIELTNQIGKRFDFDNPILKFVSIFEPKTAVSGVIGSIVKDTIKLFPNLIQQQAIEQLNTEWRLLADMNELKNHMEKSFVDFWNIVFKYKNALDEPIFPNLSILVKGILSLPHSSAAAERVFSQLFLLKTKTRNRLDVDTCSSILHTKELVGTETCCTWVPSSQLLQRKLKN